MNHCIIFQHIPKTAGSSLASLFYPYFKREAVFKCGSKDGVLTDFMKLNPTRRERLKLLIGHVDYGIHRQFKEGGKYITFLRDPIERVISHYYFIKSIQRHRYHEAAQNMDIKTFLQSGIRPRMNNCMTRMISGLNPPYNQCTDDMLDTAIHNIKQDYLFIGFVCRLQESANQLADKMHWERIDIPKRNITKDKPAIQSLPFETIEIIRQYNRIDIRLYDALIKGV